MATVTVRDDSVWIKHIEADPATNALLSQAPAGTRILMEVEGIKGEWEKMADGSDGRPTHGFKPIGAMKLHWKAMQERRGERVPLRILERKNTYLSAIQSVLTEWESDDDERAFRDL